MCGTEDDDDPFDYGRRFALTLSYPLPYGRLPTPPMTPERAAFLKEFGRFWLERAMEKSERARSGPPGDEPS